MTKLKKALRMLMAFKFIAIICFAKFAPSLIFAQDPPPAEATFTKILQVPKGTSAPAVDFKFEVTPITVDGTPYNTTTPNMPTIGTPATAGVGELTIHYDGTETTNPDSNGIMSLPKEYDNGTNKNMFHGVSWPHAGIYVYEITEKNNTFVQDTNPNTTELMTFSQAKYSVTVYIKNMDIGEGTYVFAVASVVIVKDIGDDATEIGQKITTVEPGGGEQFEYSQMIFTNNYTKTYGDPNDPLNKNTLEISKTVTGEFGNTSSYFNFNVTINAPAFITSTPTYKAYVIEGSPADIVNKANLDLHNIGNLVTTGTDTHGGYILFTSGQLTAIKLKHGQKLVFVDTPVGTSYDIIEAAFAGHVPTCTVITAGGMPQGYAVEEPNNNKPNVALALPTQFVGEGVNVNSAAFLNTGADMPPEPGIFLNNVPAIIGIVLIAGVIITYFVIRLRKIRRTAN